MADNAQPLNLQSRRRGLLLRSAETLLEMIEISGEQHDDTEMAVFYNDLRFYCICIRSGIGGASQDLGSPESRLLDQALQYLGLHLLERRLQEQLEPAKDDTPSRLEALNLDWLDVRKQGEKTRFDFVKSCLRTGQTEEERLETGCALRAYVDTFRERHTEASAEDARDINSVAIDASQPSRAVWERAQSLFSALINCKECSCHQRYAFEAKLELGTHRKPEQQKPAELSRRRPHPRAFRGGYKAHETADGVDLDVFISMERDWHEFRIQAVAEQAIRLTQTGENTEPAEQPKPLHGRGKVDRLCKQMLKAKDLRYQRLLLGLASGYLFEIRLEKSDFRIDRTLDPVSLAQSFETSPGFFTEKTKRILSLIMGYTILHLHGTSWLDLGLTAADIKFFRTDSGKIPLRPFLQVQLENDQQFSSKRNVGNGCNSTEEEEDFNYYNDLDSGHQCISLVDVAVILLELHFVKPFNKLADECDIDIVPKSRGRFFYIDVDQVFNGTIEEESGTMISEGWRSHVPEDSALLEAIDNCLSVELWEDENREALSIDTLKSRLYDKVVRPLERYLTLSFHEIPLENVDRYARTLDFSRWGQAREQKQGAQHEFVMPTAAQTSKGGAVSTHVALLGDTGGVDPDIGARMHHATQLLQVPPAISTPGLASSPELIASYGVSKFYDDEEIDGAIAGADLQRYTSWREEYSKVYERFVGRYINTNISNPVKVAILDTGVDRDHHAFWAREDNIKGKHNGHNASQRNIRDRHGHGTFVTSLILDYCPDANLYIIKITDKENAIPEAGIVEKAIRHAVDIWDVDIISMSFGWPSSDFEGQNTLQSAIDYAFSKQVLMFAAASNSGARLGRAYPASSPEVICVHSTDTYGNISKFSPTAKYHTISLATVGESVQSAWPILSSDCYEEGMKVKSGTSYATPILVGIAAFLLQYARLHLPESIAISLKRKHEMEALLRRCAERGPGYQPRNGYHYVELSLHKHNLFGQDLEEINHDITKVLRS